ncbi:hypothetical protein IMSAGC003_00403 [Lachnospiraceae bacterium]|nr:hypothetical protein IMSAGC003_00403 [Lachnospiraceae bacterium]
MKNINKISRQIMKILDLFLVFLQTFLMIIGMVLLLYPRETLDRMQEVLTDSTMTNSLKVFPLLCLVLSLARILMILYPWCRKKFLKICRH